MLSTQDALNEIARQLIIQNRIAYVKLSKTETCLLGNMDISKNQDKIEAVPADFPDMRMPWREQWHY